MNLANYDDHSSWDQGIRMCSPSEIAKQRTDAASLTDLVGPCRDLVKRSPFHCIRILHDEVSLTFATGGGIAGTDFRWRMELTRSEPRLTLEGQNGVVAALAPWRDGAWKGHWRQGVNKPVLLLPGRPSATADGTRLNIKIFGLQRSGTNYLQWLLEHNFSGVRVLVDTTGWKHGPVPAQIDWSGRDWHDPAWTPPQAAEFVLRRLEALGPAGIARLTRDFRTRRFLYVFIVKNPYAWWHSYARYQRLPLSPVVPEAIQLWCERNRHWQTFAEDQAQRSLFVCYEDLLARPEKVAEQLRDLGLEQRPGPWQDVRRAMTPLGRPSARVFDGGYYLRRDYLRSYQPEDLTQLGRLLPSGHLRRIGYDQQGNRLPSAGARRSRRTSPRLLAASFGLMPGGFSRVAQSILSRLTDRYEVHQLVINHRGGSRDDGWWIHGNRTPGDPQGLRALKSLIVETRPHLVFTLHDLFYQFRYARCLEEFPRVARVAYMPIDGELTKRGWLRAFAGFDRIVAYTEFGRRQLEDLTGEGGHGSRPGPSRIGVIPHGVDTSVFRPLGGGLGDRRAARRLVFGGGLAGEDSFVVLNANRYSTRKRIELTIAGFARFAAGKPSGVKLCLHMAPEFLGIPLTSLAERHGIRDRLLLTHHRRVHPDFSDERLNLLYNACDVGINTSEGEGWGLVSFEHAATGAPQIVPRHSACTELWEGAAALVEPRSAYRCHHLGVERRALDPVDIEQALEQLYQDRERRARMARAAYSNAIRTAYQWEEIAGQWHRLFRRLLADSPAMR